MYIYILHLHVHGTFCNVHVHRYVFLVETYLRYTVRSDFDGYMII